MLSEYLKSIMELIPAGSIVFVALAFLFRTIINHLLDKDVSTFKAKIEANANERMAQFQSELEREKIRLQISYGGIFEKQADAILELFRKIAALEPVKSFAMHSSERKSASYEEFNKNWIDLYEFYERNKILLPESTEEMFEKYSKGTFFGVSDYRRTEVSIANQNTPSQRLEEIFSRQEKIVEDMKKLDIVKKELINQFRKLIGVHNH